MYFRRNIVGEEGGEKVRLLSESPYEAGSWGRSRRVAFTAEVLQKGTYTRLVVTGRRGGPKERSTTGTWGEAEGRIKDFKRAPKADQLSCQRFWADQASYCRSGRFLAPRRIAQETG